MAPRDRALQGRGQLPASREQRADRRVIGLERAVLELRQRVVVAGGPRAQGAVLLGGDLRQRQHSEVLQQRPQERLLRVDAVLGALGQDPARQGGEDGAPPERAPVEAGVIAPAAAHEREGERDRDDRIRSEGGDGPGERPELTARRDRGRVGRAQHARRQRGIAREGVGDLPVIALLLVRQPEHLERDRGQRGQPRAGEDAALQLGREHCGGAHGVASSIVSVTLCRCALRSACLTRRSCNEQTGRPRWRREPEEGVGRVRTRIYGGRARYLVRRGAWRSRTPGSSVTPGMGVAEARRGRARAPRVLKTTA